LRSHRGRPAAHRPRPRPHRRDPRARRPRRLRLLRPADARPRPRRARAPRETRRPRRSHAADLPRGGRRGDGVNMPRILILIGCIGFIIVLFLSAVWQADIRWLHFFQAWMYVATLVLVWRGRKAGLFIGFAAAFFWAYANLFVTSFLRSGLRELSAWLETGR